MRFMNLVRSAADVGEPPPEMWAAVEELLGELARGGHLLDAGGLSPQGRTIRVRDGKLVVTDGPFSEAKELIGGYSVLEFRSLEEAVEMSVRLMELQIKHWPGWEGESEIRPILGTED